MILHQVDAFADAPFKGNPAAVCVLDAPLPDTLMQAIALEMNLSETAFLVDEGAHWGLRWFTPTVEVNLCGHATLASAHILWQLGRVKQGRQARFMTRSGLLTADQVAGGIELDFPARVAPASPAPAGLEAGLGLSASFVGRSADDYLVEVATADEVRGCAPNMSALKQVQARGVIVTAASDTQGVDFISRFFAPAAGVDEDPVTGSAHCALAPHWAERLGRDELVGYQASARGGTVRVHHRGDRVCLIGAAITVMRAELFIDAPQP